MLGVPIQKSIKDELAEMAGRADKTMAALARRVLTDYVMRSRRARRVGSKIKNAGLLGVKGGAA